MRIGVKSCGGCNPFYDRRAEVEKLEKSMEGIWFEPVRRGGSYDKILLVCGCPRACIRKYMVSGKYQNDGVSAAGCLVKEKEDFEKLQDLLLR